jgi:molecular chaperone HscB
MTKLLPVVPNCTSCEFELQLPYLCHGCGELLREPAGSLNAFRRFGLDPSFDLDDADLEVRYLDLSRRLHPDRFLRKSPQQQRRALILSSALNEAHEILGEARRRAEHLLVVSGGKTAEQDKRTPQAFLLEQMELREAVEEAQTKGDEAALAATRERAVRERAACLSAAQTFFSDASFPSPELLERVREQLNLLNYWITLGEELAKSR